jgi:hypothetical protein
VVDRHDGRAEFHSDVDFNLVEGIHILSDNARAESGREPFMSIGRG